MFSLADGITSALRTCANESTKNREFFKQTSVGHLARGLGDFADEGCLVWEAGGRWRDYIECTE